VLVGQSAEAGEHLAAGGELIQQGFLSAR
jgi:hypothetical protein